MDVPGSTACDGIHKNLRVAASSRVAEMLESGELPTGGVLRINGPASLPVAFVLAHAVAHVFEAIGCFDPKLNKYVVCIAHGSEYAVGDLIS